MNCPHRQIAETRVQLVYSEFFSVRCLVLPSSIKHIYISLSAWQASKKFFILNNSWIPFVMSAVGFGFVKICIYVERNWTSKILQNV